MPWLGASLSRTLRGMTVSKTFSLKNARTSEATWRPRFSLSRVAAASIGTAAAEHYGLPIEQIVRWDAGGEIITSSNRVTRVGEETAPPELIAIPAGARRIESHQLETKPLADEIDSFPAACRH